MTPAVYIYISKTKCKLVNELQVRHSFRKWATWYQKTKFSEGEQSKNETRGKVIKMPKSHVFVSYKKLRWDIREHKIFRAQLSHLKARNIQNNTCDYRKWFDGHFVQILPAGKTTKLHPTETKQYTMASASLCTMFAKQRKNSKYSEHAHKARVSLFNGTERTQPTLYKPIKGRP